jgi:hypothetical protein
MKKDKIIIVILSLVGSLSYGQVKKFDCTKDLEEDLWLLEKYEFFKYWVDDESIELNKESYWIFGGGNGETSTSNSILIVPKKTGTFIYQYSPIKFIDKQIVKENISIDVLTNYFKKLNNSVESNIMANAKYFLISTTLVGNLKCLKVIYSVEFPPEKNGDDYLIDFNNINW